MSRNAIDLARNVLRRKREDGGTDDGVVYDAMGNVAAPAISYDQPEEEKKKQLIERAQEIAQPIERAREVVTPQNLAAKMSYPEASFNYKDPNKEYPGDKVPAPEGYITPATAVGTIQTDTGYYPVDAEGKQLQWLNRTAVLPFYRDPTVNEIRMGMPGMLDVIGNMTGSPVGMIPASAAAAARLPKTERGANYARMFVAADPEAEATIKANKMLAEGKTAEEIHKETGIWHGPESSFPSYKLEPSSDDPSKMQRVGYMPEKPEPRPFKEISDEGLKLNRDTSNDRILNPRTGEAIESYSLEHPELLPHVPELKDLHVDIKVHPDFPPQGRFKEWDETYEGSGKWAPVLEVRASSAEEARIIAAHELQHFVSSKMGLETGNSEKNINLVRFHEQITSEAKQAAAQAKSEVDAYVDPKIQDYAEHYGVDANSANGRMTLDNLRKGLENEWWANLRQTDPEKADQILRANYINQHVKTPYELYQHMYGEAMARAVEERLNLSRAERGLTPIKYNYHEYGRAGQPDVLHPIPEKYLFSDEDISNYNMKQMDQGDFFRSGEAESKRIPTEGGGPDLTRRSFLQGTATPKQEALSAPKQKAIEAYHGTAATEDFKGFKNEEDYLGPHFGTKEAANERLSSKIDEIQDLDLNQPISPRIMPVQLEIKNPLRIPDMYYDWQPQRIVDYLSGQDGFKDISSIGRHPSSSKLKEYLRKKGYDGFVYKNDYEHKGSDSYIPFENKQIRHSLTGKLNTENRGGAVDADSKKSNTAQRALDISRFGTDAVQSAVNKARQHRRRPETPRSKQ